ncbi:hypothetical protein LCGC14_3012140 [marine sediment metagenome]|uniref:Uncharacterized protein n=1 Tax=marine sediment metagenome TaxID=412755 RepID=A0A0F8WXS4_9ZZZZ
MRSFESLKKELIRAHNNFSPYKDNRTLTPNILKRESKIMSSILKILRPVIKFIDTKIIIEDSVSTNYFAYNPSYIYDLDPLITFGDSSSSSKHIINYYKEKDKIIKGIMISLDFISSDSQSYGSDIPISEIYKIEFIRETSSTSLIIYMLRDCRIVKFDRYIHDDLFLTFDHIHSLNNPQELSVKKFLKYDSPKSVLTNILLAYHKAISENENKFPILKKSLEAILKIKEKYREVFK